MPDETVIVGPVIDLTQHLSPDAVTVLEDYKRRITLSPQGAWDARHREVVPMLWDCMSPHFRDDSSRCHSSDATWTQALLLLWPEASPYLVCKKPEFVQPANHTRVFQIGWHDTKLPPDRTVVGPGSFPHFSRTYFGCYQVWTWETPPRRNILCEFSDYVLAGHLVDPRPPTSLDKFVIFTRKVAKARPT